MPNDGVQIIDATRKRENTEEAVPEQRAIDVRVEGEHIVLKPHHETPPILEGALDLAHPQPVHEEVPVAEEKEVVAEPPRPPFSMGAFLKAAWAGFVLTLRRMKPSKHERIMLMAEEEGSITVEDVSQKLHVSGAMATRLLAQLVARGRIKRVGVHQGRYEIAVEAEDF